MKAHIPDIDSGICPYCGLTAGSEQNEKILINSVEQEYLILCICGAGYYIIYLDENYKGA